MTDDNGNDGYPPMATLNKMAGPSNPGSQSRFKLFTFLIAVIAAVLLIFAVKPEQLDVYKSFDELLFDDPALASCVKKAAAANNWRDVGHAHELRCNNPSGDGIKNLGGIEHLVDLVDLNVAFNQITDLEPLASLGRLEIVDVSHNKVSEFPVLRSAATLKRIELNYNQIESLDWLTEEHFPVLESLSIVHNHVADITPISALESIRELSIRDNLVADLAPTWQLRDLVMLDAGKNLVQDLVNIGALENLRRLFLDRNKIERLDGIEDLNKLEELDLAYNSLESTAPISGLERLQRLNLNQTGITRLTGVLALGDLDLLRISGNPDLACADITAAVIEYGESAIRTDKTCSRDDAAVPVQ